MIFKGAVQTSTGSVYEIFLYGLQVRVRKLLYLKLCTILSSGVSAFVCFWMESDKM